MAAKSLTIRKSLIMSFAEKYTTFAFSVASVVIVSRLLTPEEIGIFSVAVGMTTLANVLRTFGVSDYLVQRPDASQEAVRTAFTINLIFAWSLAGIIFGASWPLEVVFKNEGIGRVLRVMSGSFLLVPFGVTAMAMLKRHMAFGALYKINVSSSITRSCMTVGLAYAGFSYMSMAWASLGSMAVMVIGSALWGWQFRVRGVSLACWREVLPFGVKMTTTDIAVQLGEQSANIIIGKTLGFAAAGFYSRGYGPVNMFQEKVVSAIKRVAFPAFAREHREHGSTLWLYIRALVYLSGLSWPCFAFAILMAAPIIRIMFGDQWGAAVPLMRWLCAAAIVGTLTYQCNQFFVAVGRVGDAARIEVTYQLARVVITIAAAFLGVVAVAAAQIVVYALAAKLYYTRITSITGAAFTTILAANVPSIVTTITTCLVPLVVYLWPGLLDEHMMAGFGIALIGAGIGWLVGLRIAAHPLLSELRRGVAYVDARRKRVQRSA